MTAPVRVRDLVHAYGTEPVLEVPQLELDPGRVHLAGPNGAGKTTLLTILATLVRPTRGEVHVAGHRLADQGKAARAHLGFVGHEPSLHPDLSVQDGLQLHARLHGRPDDHVEATLDQWGLAELASRPLAELSFGQRRRADLARALLHDPTVVLLDEPDRGLDSAALDRLEDALDRADPELVLAASPDEPPIPCERELSLSEGRVEEGSP